MFSFLSARTPRSPSAPLLSSLSFPVHATGVALSQVQNLSFALDKFQRRTTAPLVQEEKENQRRQSLHPPCEKKDCNCTFKFFLHFSCCKVLNKHCQVSVLSLLSSLEFPYPCLKVPLILALMEF